MNLQPHQRQFAHTYTGPAYPQQPPQHQQNFTGPKAPDPCYNCGSPQHVAQHCREARRAVPAGSLNQAPRPQRGGFKKNNSKPIVTRFAPPPSYSNGPYSQQQPSFPQVGPYQPHQQPPQQQWQQQPQGYGPHAQTWQQPQQQQQQQQQQQPYVAPTAVPPQAPTYGPHQPQVPQYGYGQPPPPYSQQQHPYSYPPKPNWSIPAPAPTTPQPVHPQYNPGPQLHPQSPYPQQQNYQQYPQQSVQSPYTPQGFQQTPPAQNYGSQTQQPTAPNNIPTSQQQQPPPPKPPPCFPNADKHTNPTAKSGVIIWRPAQPTEIPLAPTFTETDEQRALPKPISVQKRPSKYFDAKGNRLDRDLAAYEPGSEMLKDPVFASVRTGESMVAQPLEFVLPDEEEPEASEGAESMLKAEGDDAESDTTEAAVDASKQDGVLSETKRSWNWQSAASVQAGRQRGRTSNSGNQGKRKSRSPLDNNRPQKHRVREAPAALPQPSHHPLPPKPVAAPPPPQQFHHGSGGGGGNGGGSGGGGGGRGRGARGGKQRNHPYARRSASPVRHMLVDNQRRERGRGRQGQAGGGQ